MAQLQWIMKKLVLIMAACVAGCQAAADVPAPPPSQPQPQSATPVTGPHQPFVGSIPAGFSQGLPVGLQLIGNYFDEARLLNVAHQFQLNSDWHLQTAEVK